MANRFYGQFDAKYLWNSRRSAHHFNEGQPTLFMHGAKLVIYYQSLSAFVMGNDAFMENVIAGNEKVLTASV